VSTYRLLFLIDNIAVFPPPFRIYKAAFAECQINTFVENPYIQENGSTSRLQEKLLGLLLEIPYVLFARPPTSLE
jgi:hypothetical protein